MFIEIAATDGPITEARRSALAEIVSAAGFTNRQVAFVTAFQDRNAPAFKKSVPDLAWGSFAWCVTEPEHLIAFDGSLAGGATLLSDYFRAV